MKDPLKQIEELKQENKQLKKQLKDLVQKSSHTRSNLNTFKDAFSILGVAIVSTDSEGKILEFNDSFVKYIQDDDPDIIGKNINDCLEIYNSETNKKVTDLTALPKEKNHYVARSGKYYVLYQNNRQVQISLGCFPKVEADRKNILSYVIIEKYDDWTRKVTDTRFNLINHSTEKNLEDMLTHAVDEVCRFVNSPIGFFHFVSEDELSLDLQVWSTSTLEHFCSANMDTRHYDVSEAGVWVECIHKRKAVIHNDYESLKNKKGLPAGHATVTRELVVPVFRRNKIVAIIGVGNKAEDYSEEDMEIVTYLADEIWNIVESKRMMEALKMSENRFKSLVNNSPSGILIIGDNYKIDYLNKESCKILGADPDQLLGLDFRAILHEDYKDEVGKRYKDRRNGLDVPQHYRIKIKRLDGSIRTAEMTATLIKEGFNKQITFAQIVDITDKLHTENRAKYNKDRYRSLIENSPDAIVTSDLDGTVQSVNQKALELFHFYSIEEIHELGKTIFDYRNTTDLEHSSRFIDRILKHESIFQENIEFLRTDNTTFIGELSATVTKNLEGENNGFMITIRDVTERIKTEKELQENRLFLQNMFDAIQDGIVVIDPEMRVVMTNKWMEERFSATMPLAGKLCQHAIKLSDTACSICPTKKTLFSGELHSEIVPFVDENGVTTWFQFNAYPVKDENNNTSFVIEYLKDITESRNIEIELEDKERFISAVANTAPVMINVFDVQTNNIIYLNKATEKMLGYSTDEIISSIKEENLILIHPDDISSVREHVNRIVLSETDSIHEHIYRIKHKNGDYRLLRAFERPFERNNGQVTKMISVSVDITEQEEASRAVKETTKRLSNIMVAANDGMWDWQIKENIVVFDPRYYEMAGYAVNEFPHKYEEFEKRVHVDDYSNTFNDIQRHLNGDVERLLTEFRYKRKDGSYMWILGRGIIVERDPEGNPVRMVGTHTEITEFKKIQEHVLKLSKAVEQSPEGVVITNKEGVIEYINSRFTEISGYTEEEAIGQTPRILKSGKQDPSFYNDLWSTINSGRSWEGEVLNKKKNGTTYWERLNIAPLINEAGEITHFVSVREDITEKKKMLNDLKRAKEMAEESDRLKSAFLANMSHEIRTPMNGILGFTELLEANDITEEQRNEYLQIIRKSGDRMMNTINDIIDISKIEAGQTELALSEANVNDHMKYLYNFFIKEVENKGLQLSFTKGLSADEALINTDHEKLVAVLSNLIKNSIKYSHAGEIEFGYKLEYEYLVFYVKDEGIGISKDRQDAIFDRFVQADLTITKPYEGSGLGLSISKAFIDMMDGKIWLESEVHKGTTFYFKIPYQPVNIKTESSSSVTQSYMDSYQDLTILIAEDDESAYFFLHELLKNRCKRIIHAKTGLEAVEYARTDKDIGLILMDIKMPDLDGYSATRKIREFNPSVPIIGQTAYALVGDRQKVEEAGCDDYISKPIDRNKLYEIIKKHVH